MATSDQDSEVIRWGLGIFDPEPSPYPGYYGGGSVEVVQNDGHYGYVSDHYSIADCSHVENDEMIAMTLQDEFSRLDVAQDEFFQANDRANDWYRVPSSDYVSDNDCSNEESDDRNPSSLCSSPDYGDGSSYSSELSDEGEVGKRLGQLVSIPHVPRINRDIPSVDEATSDHERLLNRLQLYGFVEVKVQGDGNCQFRALSDQLYNTRDRHKMVRRKVVSQLKSQREIYEGYIPMEYGDYLNKMSKNGEWGDHVTLQAAADAYRVKILVMTSFKDTCYIEILPIDQNPKGVISLSFWAEVHYNSIYFQGDSTSASKKKKKWWSFGSKQ